MKRRSGVFFAYDLILALAGLLMLPWAVWRMIRSPHFRRSLPGRLGWVQALPPAEGRVLLHGVSVGEIKALRPLVALLREQLPERSLVVSASTPTGLAMARTQFPELQVVEYPVDLPGACRRFLARVQPSLVILAELEIWPNFLRCCNRRNVQLAIVNGRITQKSMSGYRRVQKWLPQFERIALYGVQNERYAERFRRLEVPNERIVVTGNLKYDNLPTAAEDEAFRRSGWAERIAGRPLAVLASTHDDEEEQLLKAWDAAGGEALLAVVPRHPRRAEEVLTAVRANAGGRPVLRRSTLADGPLPERAVLVVDTFGELESLYRAARCAFLGGSLVPHGGQNMLEAAALGLPVVVGPHVDNFAEEVALLREAGGLLEARHAPAVVECLLNWLEDAAAAAQTGQAAASALESRRGAAHSTLSALRACGLLEPSPERLPLP